MPNGDKCPKGMPYGQWLREKGIGMRVTEAVHEDSGIPQHVHNAFTNKTQEEFERAKACQGKLIDPEDMDNKELDLEKLVGPGVV